VGVNSGEPDTRVGGSWYDRVGAFGTTPATLVGSWPLAQTEAGVITMDGTDLLHALKLTPSVTKAIHCRPIFQIRRETMPGFYQFLLKSGHRKRL
jgi:hypothetical protein